MGTTQSNNGKLTPDNLQYTKSCLDNAGVEHLIEREHLPKWAFCTFIEDKNLGMDLNEVNKDHLEDRLPEWVLEEYRRKEWSEKTSIPRWAVNEFFQKHNRIVFA